MNNKQIKDFIKAIKKFNTIEEVINLENNKNYFSNLDLSLSILSNQTNFDKENINKMVKIILEDYNQKYKTKIEYTEKDNYHEVFSKIIYGINLRLNQILNDEINEFIVEKVVNHNE